MNKFVYAVIVACLSTLVYAAAVQWPYTKVQVDEYEAWERVKYLLVELTNDAGTYNDHEMTDSVRYNAAARVHGTAEAIRHALEPLASYPDESESVNDTLIYVAGIEGRVK